MNTRLLKPLRTPAGPGPATRPRDAIIIGIPGLILVAGFVVPLLLMIRASFVPSDATPLWSGMTFDQYRALGQSAVLRAIVNAVELALIVAVCAVVIAYPLTYLIQAASRRVQTLWLILILATLSLSDVLVTFSWQVMLARRMWVFKLLLWLGLVDPGASLIPSFPATICCLLYVVVPFSVLVLYPALSRIDPQWIEAARTMGATPTRVFFGVVVPNTRQAIVLAFMMACVVSLGAYVMPLVLGRPRDWTLAVLISNAALANDDLPGAAAMSVAMLAVTAGLAVAVWAALRGKGVRA